MQKSLRIIRIVLAIFFLITALIYFIYGHKSPPIVIGAAKMHIAPILLSEILGITLAWLIITFVWGRIYCSAVCPLGTLQDIIIRIRAMMPRFHRISRYKNASRMRLHIFLIYLICMVAGLSIIPLALEPWYMFGNIESIFGADEMKTTWIHFGYGASAGIVIGIISLLLVGGFAMLRGRDFCNEVCPIGTALSFMSKSSAFVIAIDPDKCDSCMKCEEGCKASCIKVVSRYVDNTRCVRCFNCVSVCPHSAINYTMERKRPATPLFQSRKTANHP